MGWLDGAGWRVDSHIARGIARAALGASGCWTVGGLASRRAPTNVAARRCTLTHAPTLHPAPRRPIRSRADAAPGVRPNEDPTDRRANGEMARAA